MQTNQISSMIDSGAHSLADFAATFLTPLFEAGTITPFPSATRYAICYGELCAYAGDELVATWSSEVPGCAEDVCTDDPDYTHDYSGEWITSFAARYSDV